MAKKEKFLLSLKNYLEENKIKNRDKILTKYSNLMEDKIKEGKKISEVIGEIGSFSNIVKKEEIKNKLIEKTRKFAISCKSNCKIIADKIRNIKPYIEKLEKEEIKEIENKKQRIKNLIWWKKTLYIIYRIFLYIVIILFSFILIWLSTIFVASLFMFLDGVKFIGISIFILSLIILLCWFVIILNKIATYRKISFRKYLYPFIALLILIGLSTGIILIQYFKFEHVNKVTEKYGVTTFVKKFNLPRDNSKKYYIHFNSWYKNKYIIHYDETLINQVKVEVDYYECFYDIYHTIKGSTLYISLKKDYRDLISFYIENLKENKIYDSKELSRNIVNIYINEIDYERLIIVD